MWSFKTRIPGYSFKTTKDSCLTRSKSLKSSSNLVPSAPPTFSLTIYRGERNRETRREEKKMLREDSDTGNHFMMRQDSIPTFTCKHTNGLKCMWHIRPENLKNMKWHKTVVRLYTTTYENILTSYGAIPALSLKTVWYNLSTLKHAD